MSNDALVMAYIHSANIACGYHAGDSQTMRATIDLCVQYGVQIGAHPSFEDREDFGRREMNLPGREIKKLIISQLSELNEIAIAVGKKLHHVKPHGALYNMSARDPVLAATIAKTIRDFDPALIIYGLSGSHSITEAKRLGLKTRSEVFGDRRYRDDGSLVPRSDPQALIENVEEVVAQVEQMAGKGTVRTLSGKDIPVLAETICVHGDGAYALEFAKAIAEILKNSK
jgi:5-oxoprolinase (ATP-hydrolysing) subunit A